MLEKENILQDKTWSPPAQMFPGSQGMRWSYTINWVSRSACTTGSPRSSASAANCSSVGGVTKEALLTLRYVISNSTSMLSVRSRRTLSMRRKFVKRRRPTCSDTLTIFTLSACTPAVNATLSVKACRRAGVNSSIPT